MEEREALTLGSGGRDTARYSWLLVAVLLALFLPPLLRATELHVPTLRIGLSVVLVAALFTISRRRAVLVAGLLLGVPALVFDWASWITASRGFAMLSSLAASGFLALVTATLGARLLATDRVTSDTILGGACLYLLLGILWVTLYSFAEIAQPGSLWIEGAPLTDGSVPGETFRHPEILYFSFVTLTTLGYGDIVPRSDAMRALAAGEAIVGQLYITIFIARLVGLHLAHGRPVPRPPVD
ncbi:MAG: ion channel [Myxococcota bacterium]